MRYIKHYYVDYENQSSFLVSTNTSPNGKTHPTVKGLDVKVWCNDDQGIDYCLSVCADDASLPLLNGIEEITFDQWAAEAKTQFDRIKETSSIVMDTTSIETIKDAFARLAEENQPTNP